ncbi:acyltransferase [Massilia luteola]|jgi:peptidoglycan/LPS O-acetylase OafA/YrhL|uniref:acyltransferase family protein n=1 Tax=Massilia luteola TaxID=3081751 RepID=UPI002ACC364F|nr:acyltransferase [Massilia sp. Gc5]
MTARTLEQATASHDNGFNLVRLVCATLVVVFHAFPMNSARPGASDPVSPLLAPHTDLGALAVGVFFLISGIFISQSWERDPHLGRYALRRAARIVPGLFVCLLLTTALAVGLFSSTGWRGMLAPAPWRYIFGNTTLHWLHYIIPPEELKLPGVLGGEPLNGPLWTLYWEGRMYVVVALVGLAAALPLRTWMRGAALFLLAAANLFPDVIGGYVWETRLWSLFLTGMLLHTLARDLRVGWRHVACALALAGLNWTRSAALTPSPLTWFGILLVAGTLALAVGSVRLPFAAHLQRHDYSYGIYIYHWPVLLMLRTAFAPLGHWRLLALGLLVTGVLAVLSWHLVEAPALRAVRRLLRRHAGSAASPAVPARPRERA